MNTFVTFSILAFAAPFIAFAQDIRFESGVTNVHVDALVQHNGQRVRGLTKDDFVVRDEGKVQPILVFEEETVPLDLIVVIDTTSGLEFQHRKSNREQELSAAMDALRQTRAKDRTAVISFIPRLEQEFTSDPEKIAAAMERAAHSNSWNQARSLPLQWAALLLAFDAKAQGTNGNGDRKRAILMVTKDGSRAWSPDEPVIQQLWSMDAALHIIVVPADRSRNSPIFAPRSDNAAHIARATGGDILIDREGSLERSFPDLLARIRSSYSMWYRAPESKLGELHHIMVELNESAKKKYPNTEIKAREGYIAP